MAKKSATPETEVEEGEAAESTETAAAAEPAAPKAARKPKAAGGKAKAGAKKAGAKAAAAPKSKAKKGKAAAKGKTAKAGKRSNGNGAAPEKSKDNSAAEAYARKVMKDYGAVTVVRATAQKFPAMKRGELLSILVDTLGINKFTASRQFHAARSGEVELDLSSL